MKDGKELLTPVVDESEKPTVHYSVRFGTFKYILIYCIGFFKRCLLRKAAKV